MKRRLSWRFAAVLFVAACAGSWSLDAQTPAKRPVSYDVMDYWRSISTPRLSRDGQWLVYSLTSQGDDADMILRNLKTGQETHQARGTGATFTPDGKFVVFTIALPKAEEDAAAAAAAPAGGGGAAAVGGAVTPVTGGGGGRAGGGRAGGAGRGSLGIMSLPDAKVTVIDRVATFRMPDESSTWLAYKKAAAGGTGRGNRAGGAAGGGRAGARGGATGATGAAATEPTAQGEGANANAPAPQEKRKDPGTDLILRNLATGQETTIAETTDFVWNKDGSWLVYGVSSADGSKDGAFARKMSDGSTVALHTGKGNYRDLVFDDAGKQLAFMSDQAEYDKKVSPSRIYYWKAGDASAAELVSPATKGMPAGMVLAENGAPRFSNDGLRLFFATAPPPPPPADPSVKTPAPTKVDLWSYKDPLVQPNQQLRAAQDRNRSYRAVMFLADKRFVQLASPDLPTVNANEDPVRTLGTSGAKYEQEISWDTSYNDVYLIDIRTGTRKKLLEHYNGSVSLSTGGNYVLYFDEPTGQWFTYRVADGTRTNLTAALPAKFYNEKHDTPDLPPSLGTAGWTEGDKSVLLYDEFDIWEVRPDGTGARMVTNGEGRKQHLVFRYRAMDDGAGAAAGGGRGGGAGGGASVIPATKPLLLSTTNDDTRASGFYRVNLTGTAAPEKIIMMDKAVGAPIKAKDADVVIFTESRFEEFPNYWVSDTNFTSPKKVTDANPQQAQYNWGKAEKISYVNADGKTLDAILVKPEDFDPKKKYPLMVYIYEELSDGLHGYRAPNVGSSSINITRYVSNGYVVLEPDIVYETGYPGPSAMKCVIPAVNSILAQGYIDPKRIGIQGHSWGGYQITYMITQTNMFAAVEAGASVSNMLSAYGGIRWGTGVVREMQYEKGQSRIGAPPWEAPLQYIENSPIFWIERIHTPYLTMHNDADTAVPWQQGIEFSTAMRRLGKPSWMFTFNGEQHGLTNRDNMKYWQVHMDEFFDYYLLGKSKPSWMDAGVPFLQKGMRDVSPLFKRATPAPAPGAGKGGGS